MFISHRHGAVPFPTQLVPVSLALQLLSTRIVLLVHKDSESGWIFLKPARISSRPARNGSAPIVGLGQIPAWFIQSSTFTKKQINKVGINNDHGDEHDLNNNKGDHASVDVLG